MASAPGGRGNSLSGTGAIQIPLALASQNSLRRLQTLVLQASTSATPPSSCACPSESVPPAAAGEFPVGRGRECKPSKGVCLTLTCTLYCMNEILDIYSCMWVSSLVSLSFCCLRNTKIRFIGILLTVGIQSNSRMQMSIFDLIGSNYDLKSIFQGVWLCFWLKVTSP